MVSNVIVLIVEADLQRRKVVNIKFGVGWQTLAVVERRGRA